ncbi:hypothetical protein KFL_002390030 [Klebsormidium nitens]|uniref:Uncharacterized protein n=1 Tax=Klebsormidium nitens TaxID=105231 RepID=A0A1Y1I3J5_KLENI|nr:hypothetical protein KFL_002390030 [Klebsormidium nitens]|eukprot:GAQ85510.1 hypothetical protein KFL_002390030 [Klebsormidium nitens]
MMFVKGSGGKTRIAAGGLVAPLAQGPTKARGLVALHWRTAEIPSCPEARMRMPLKSSTLGGCPCLLDNGHVDEAPPPDSSFHKYAQPPPPPKSSGVRLPEGPSSARS